MLIILCCLLAISVAFNILVSYLFLSVHEGGPMRIVVAILVVILFVVTFFLGMGFPAKAHMHDRPDLDSWFGGLTSGSGPCCSFAEGTVVKDVDWTIRGEGQQCDLAINDEANNYKGTYCVRLDDRWYLVPDKAVLTVPNRYGPALVWPVYSINLNSPNKERKLITIRCFIRGAET